MKAYQRLNMIMVALSTVLLLAFSSSGYAGDKYREMINCDLHRGVCTQSLAGSNVTLAVTVFSGQTRRHGMAQIKKFYLPARGDIYDHRRHPFYHQGCSLLSFTGAEKFRGLLPLL
ncbi:MAG: hypothetical protein PVG06_01270 [Desulfobacterales bacterium]|jgi:hypothetical protein